MRPSRKFVTDSQVLNYSEYTEDTEQDGSYVSEEETGYDQFDAQSLGDRSDAEHYDEDGYVPNIPVLTEEQLEAQRDNGNTE